MCKKLTHSLLLSLFYFFNALLPALAQDAPLYYIHAYNNQFFQNPAFAGSEGGAVFFLNYHKQLIGILPNSPEHTSLTFHSPLRNSNSAVGFRVSTFRRSFLNTTGASGSYAFKLNFDPARNHFLRLGLSLGFLLNSFDADLLSESDPALINRLNNKLRPDGQFGIHYQFRDFQLGAALPQLFKSVSAQNTAIFETTSPFKNILLTAGYSFGLTQQLTFKPLLTYRLFEYEQHSGYELNGTFNFENKVWFGASYRESYGLAITFGIKFKGTVSVSYAYKVPDAQTYNYANPAHEIQIGLFLPRKQAALAVEKEEEKPLPKPDTLIARQPQKPIDTLPKPPDIKPADIPPATTPIERTVVQGKEENDLPTSNYIVVGSFQYEKNARSFSNVLRNEKYEAQVGFNSVNQRHYVYLYHSDDLPATRAELNKIRAKTGFEEAWILKVIQSK